MGRDYHVTGGHEAEAEAAQRAKKPSRVGLWILKVLGFRGTPPRPEITRVPSPRHDKTIREPKRGPAGD